MGKNLPKERVCVICSAKFVSANPMVVKTCSTKCRGILIARNNTARFDKERGFHHEGKCSECGAPTKRVRDLTCSRACAARRMSKSANGVTRSRWGGSWCVYTPPSAFDKKYMLDILHRKGYSPGENARSEKYTYTITENGNIEWWDLKPSRDSYDWKTSFGEEQSHDCVCVEQETEEESSHKRAFKELRAGLEDWIATVEAPMGFKESNWVF